MKLRTPPLPVLAALGMLAAMGADWPDYRGPLRDGISEEKDLPLDWSPDGKNLLWKVPHGGRSAPVVFANRVYVLNAAGKDGAVQERLMCLDASSGKTLWERRWNVYHSDVPPHRIAWSSPAVDPESGSVYAFGGGGTLAAFSGDGKPLWERSLPEDFGLITTHGGRTPSPVIEEDLVIVGGLSSGWGPMARAAHRFFAFDKRSGQLAYVYTAAGRPFDTTYSPPVVARIGSQRLFISGAGDGAYHAFQAATGVPAWRYAISKRGINTGAVVNGSTVYVSHSEENLESNEMGLLAAIDGNARGEIKDAQAKWLLRGLQQGYSNPVLDGGRYYQIDNSSNLLAFDAESGRELWKQNLGTIQRSSPVMAGGHLYAGNENGRFYILKPRPDGVDIVSKVQLGTEDNPELITASPAVSNGRVFLVTQDNIYCFGSKTAGTARAAPHRDAAPPLGAPAYLQIRPADVALGPGRSVQLHARLYDENGRFLRTAKPSFRLDAIGGAVSPDGLYSAPTSASPQAGLIHASAEGLEAAIGARVLPPPPLGEDFEGLKPGPPPRGWVNAAGKFEVRQVEDRKVLVKLADNPFTKRARIFIGHSGMQDYTVEAEVLANEKRRQMGDAGLVAQRYMLVLFGNSQKLMIQPWQPNTHSSVSVPFKWKAGAWYRMKLRTANQPDGRVRASGKVWPAGEPEPDSWTIERVDPIGNREGSPGIYADAPFEIYFDNVKVSSNAQ